MKKHLILPACACLLFLNSCSGLSIGTGGPDNDTSSNDDSWHATEQQIFAQQAADTQNMVNQITAESAAAAMTPIPPQ